MLSLKIKAPFRPLLRAVRGGFSLTRGERFFIGGISLIFLIGLAVRQWTLARREPVVYAPPGLQESAGTNNVNGNGKP